MKLTNVALLGIFLTTSFLFTPTNAAFSDEADEGTKPFIQQLTTALKDNDDPARDAALGTLGKPEQTFNVYYATLQTIIKSPIDPLIKKELMGRVAHMSCVDMKSLAQEYLDHDCNLLGLACLMRELPVVRWLSVNGWDVVAPYRDSQFGSLCLTPFQCLFAPKKLQVKPFVKSDSAYAEIKKLI